MSDMEITEAEVERIQTEAARGDLGAQRFMRDLAFDRVRTGQLDFDLGCFEALFWSTNAALIGDHNDRMVHAAARFYTAQALSNSDRTHEAEWQITEALVTLDQLVDEDNANAVSALASMAKQIPPEILAAASLRKKEIEQ